MGGDKFISAPFDFSEPEKLSFVSSTYQVKVQVEVQQNLTPISDWLVTNDFFTLDKV